MAKTIFLLFILISSLSSNSQSYIKGNAASALLLIPNFGYETKLNSKFSFQLDVTASFLKFKSTSPQMTSEVKTRKNCYKMIPDFWCNNNKFKWTIVK